MGSEKRQKLEQVRQYMERSLKLLSQGASYLSREEVEKASESIWGSVASSLNALAVLKEIKLTSHGELKTFAKQLSMELRDEDLYRAFIDAESLHANFYHSFLDVESVHIKAKNVEHLVRKVGEMVERELLGRT